MANANEPPAPHLTGAAVICHTEQDTRAFGMALGRKLEPGAVVRIEGPMGAGKTCLVGGIASAMGGNPAEVSSPTFSIIHEYAGGRLIHADFYRLEQEGEVLGVGLEDYLSSGCTLAIEWASKFSHLLPASSWTVMITIEGEARCIRATPPAR